MWFIVEGETQKPIQLSGGRGKRASFNQMKNADSTLRLHSVLTTAGCPRNRAESRTCQVIINLCGSFRFGAVPFIWPIKIPFHFSSRKSKHRSL